MIFEAQTMLINSFQTVWLEKWRNVKYRYELQSFCYTFKDRKSILDVLECWNGSSVGKYSPPRFLLDLSKDVFTSNEAQTCSPAKIFLWLNLGISHPTTLLSQSVAGGAVAPAPAPYFSVLMCWEKRCGQQQLSSAPLASLLSTVKVRVGGAAAFLVGGRGLYNRQGWNNKWVLSLFYLSNENDSLFPI